MAEEINTTAPTALTSAKMASIGVLVVDDDYNIAQLVKSVLNQLGFGHIYVTYNGQQAISLLRHKTVDLVITDWQMDTMNGVDLVRAIRQMPGAGLRFVPVIMLTGQAERRDVEIARDVGVNEFVVKPFTAKTLCDKIRQIVEKPKRFIVTPTYCGPDRRRGNQAPPQGTDRRVNKREIEQPIPRK